MCRQAEFRTSGLNVDDRLVAAGFPLGFLLVGNHYVYRVSAPLHFLRPWLTDALRFSGLIGVPAPNGLIPQAPMHTQSLVVMGIRGKDDEEKGHSADGETALGGVREGVEHPVAVVEQRGTWSTILAESKRTEDCVVSNLMQGSLCLVLMTGPFLHVLGLVPRGGRGPAHASRR